MLSHGYSFQGAKSTDLGSDFSFFRKFLEQLFLDEAVSGGGEVIPRNGLELGFPLPSLGELGCGNGICKIYKEKSGHAIINLSLGCFWIKEKMKMEKFRDLCVVSR